MTDKLLPCPFCGGEGHHSQDGRSLFYGCRVSCKRCDCVISDKSRELVADKWNNRATPQAANATYRIGGVAVALVLMRSNLERQTSFDMLPEILADVLAYIAHLEAAQAANDNWRPISEAPVNESVLVFIPNAEHYGHGVYRAIQIDMGTGRRWSVSGLHMGRDCGPEQQPEK